MPAPSVDASPPSSTGAEFWRVVDELSRRGFLGGVAGTAGLAGLAACGSDNRPGRRSDAAGDTRTLTTAKGRVEVPVHPTRIACLDPGFSWQTLLEVGVTPVGLPLVVNSIVQPANRSVAARIPKLVDDTGEIDVEKVAEVRPDLILANAGPSLDKQHAALSRIAPVAAYAFRFPSDWAALARSYANAVGRAPRLASVSARFDQKVAALRDEHGALIAEQKWALVTESSNKVFLWGSRASSGPVLSAAGAKFSSGAPDATTPFTEVSLEKLDLLRDATVLLYGAGTDGMPYADTSRLLDQPLFKRLPAARAGHVYPLPSWFAYCYQDAIAQVAGLTTACESIAKKR